MFYVYLLESEDGHLYIGYTSDLKKRLQEHNQGLNSSTKRYGDKWKVIYYEASLNEVDARRREKYLKTTQGGRLVKRRLKEYFYQKNLAD